MGEFLSGLGLMSFQAGCVVVVVLLVRFLFEKLRVPKKYAMLLWLVPYLCMICPWKIESAFGFWKQPQEYQLERVNYMLQEAEAFVEKSSQEAVVDNAQGLPEFEDETQNTQASDDAENWEQANNFADWQPVNNSKDWLPPDVQNSGATQDTNKENDAVMTDTDSTVAVVGLNGAAESSVLKSFQGAEKVAMIVFGVWLAGVLGILSYSVISYVKLKKKLICSVNLRENIYIADDIQVPFVLGILCPKIYLPSGMNQENRLYVLAHENTHIRRRDTFWKPAALLITVGHWFNPLAWVALHFMEKDMEMACDEETVQRLGLEQKQAYATALLQLSSGRRFALGVPLAFGERNVKDRIRNIVKYKKTLGMVSVTAVVLVVVLVVVFMSSASICELQNVEEEWAVFHAVDDRVSVVMNGERTEFPAVYCQEFSEFFLELEVARNPISLSRDEDRTKDIAIGFDEERFYYLNDDCTEIWSDNRVKPGFSYRIQNPQEVKDFLERMLGSVAEAENKDAGQDENKPQNGTEETNKAELGIDAQLSVIVGEKELWLHKFSDYTYFTVTDLDENGRLELIRSFMEGTGRYTTTDMYEITEDGTGLKEVNIDFARGESEPDIIEDKVEAYEDEAGVFYYVFQDYIRGGYSEHQYYQHAVKLENGKVESEVLAEHYEFWDETETTLTYKNAAGEVITEEEYVNAAKKRFADLKRYQAVFGWQEMTEYEKAGEQELLRALEESWESFYLSEEGVAGSNVDLPEGAVQIAVPKPFITEDTHEGVAGVVLDYASEDRIVFHDYYGLFVYDKEKGLIGEIDLSAIGMEMIQGSNAWGVQVTADGSRLYMHGMEDEDMYVYDVERNHLYRCEKYDVSGIDMFQGLLDTQACVESDYTVARSWHCVKVGENSYHYLESGSGLPIDFSWVVEQYPGTGNTTRQSISIFENYEGEWSALCSDAKHMTSVEKNMLEQLEVIYADRKSWTLGDVENCSFAVTDLDNNGRLEIVVTNIQDGKQSGDSRIFEVSKDLSALVKVKQDANEFAPKLFEDTITAFRNESGIYYVCYDYDDTGDDGAYEVYQSLQLQNGRLTCKELCWKKTEFQQGRGMTTAYYDGEGGSISEEVYRQLVKSIFRDTYQWQVHINWQDVTMFGKEHKAEWVKALRTSLEGFVLQRVEREAVLSTPQSVNETPEVFTMEDLIVLFKANKVAETMRNYVEQDGLLPTNIKHSYNEEGLTWHYSYDLEYEGRSYTLRADYWNPLKAQEYGHAENQLDTIMLYENASGDALMLYSNNFLNGTVPLMHIEDFLAKEYDLEQYVSIVLPEGAYLGDYSIGMNDFFEGCLILGDFEEMVHGEGAPDEWYAAGGIGVAGKEVLEDRATFENGKLVDFHWANNHMWGGKVETLENCEIPAVLYHLGFDVFTMSELEEYARENNVSADEVDYVSDYWYVFFAEPGGEHVYTVFLNQAYFSKEDVVKLAESMKFK